jgi:hypothetical protein
MIRQRRSPTYPQSVISAEVRSFSDTKTRLHPIASSVAGEVVAIDDTLVDQANRGLLIVTWVSTANAIANLEGLTTSGWGVRGTVRVTAQTTTYGQFFYDEASCSSINSTSEIAAFMSRIYWLANQDLIDDALDATFDYIYELYSQELHSDCNYLFNFIDLNKITPAIMVGLLTASANMSEVRVSRSWLYGQVKNLLMATQGTHIAELLLDGLE